MGSLFVLDLILRRLIPVVCGVLLASMIVFTIYTVILRTVFLNPPFWGDTLTMFANVWLVMLAFALSIRERKSIALDLFSSVLPTRIAFIINMGWSVIFCFIGLLMLVYGYQAASQIAGSYWELGNMPKSVPMMILPVAGALVALAALVVIIEDVQQFRRVSGGSRRLTE